MAYCFVDRDAQHNVSNSEITRTFKGALSYHSAGEVSPILSLDHNRFIDNGQQFYGNFSTCDAAIHLDVQNMHSMFFRVSKGKCIIFINICNVKRLYKLNTVMG